MFFGHLFVHAHDGYEKFMTYLGLNLNLNWPNPKYALPIVHAEADYHAPMYHGMTINMSITVIKIGQTAFTTEYKFWGAADQMYAHAYLVHCCVDTKTGKPKNLPDELLTRLKNQ